jgi:hypothetical protein
MTHSLNEKFGWMKIADIFSVQIVAEKKHKSKFGGKWNVQVINREYEYLLKCRVLNVNNKMMNMLFIL